MNKIIKEDDFFRVGDDVVVNKHTPRMHDDVRDWICNSVAKVFAIEPLLHDENEYCIGFDFEKRGLHDGSKSTNLPDRRNRYQYVRKNDITKLDFPKFRSVEKEAEYFKNEFIKLRGRTFVVLDELRVKKDNELNELKEKLNDKVNIPKNCLGWQKEGFIVTRIDDYNFLTIMQKREIKIDSFSCGGFSVKLPSELVYSGKVYLACNFDGSGGFVSYGVYTPKFKPFISFHTARDGSGMSRVCIGDLKIKPKLDMVEIGKSFDEYQKLLEIANPYSYLNSSFDDKILYQNKLKQIRNYVSNYIDDYHKNTGVCRNCGRVGDDCGCDRCENCDRHYDDCECNECGSCGGMVDSICCNELCDGCCEDNCEHCSGCGQNFDGYCEVCNTGIGCGCCGCEKKS